MLKRHPDYTEDEWEKLSPAAQSRCWRATGHVVSLHNLQEEDTSYLALTGEQRTQAACALSMLVYDSVKPGPTPWMQTPLLRTYGRTYRVAD